MVEEPNIRFCQILFEGYCIAVGYMQLAFVSVFSNKRSDHTSLGRSSVAASVEVVDNREEHCWVNHYHCAWHCFDSLN